MPTRSRLATGIYEDRFGRSVVYHVHGQPKETRFPLDTPLDRLQRWRTRALADAIDIAPRDPRGSLARDAVRYLKRLKGQPGYKSEKSHLKAWVMRLPRRPRWSLTREDVELAIAAWRETVAARTIRHRCRVLAAVYHRLDGPRAPTPVDDAVLPARPKPRPVSVDDAAIKAVAERLQAHEATHRLRDAKTRARFLVLATTGRRPAEVKRTAREDLDLDRRLWFTRTAKGGRNTIVMLNDEMFAAWQLFIGAKAWGAYDDRSFSKTLKRNGWPQTIRPYNLRHSTALAIRARGGDLEDVQDQLGHASITTAREFYLHALPARQAAISQRLAGRFPLTVFTPPAPRPPTTTSRRQDAKERVFSGGFEVSTSKPDTPTAEPPKRKQA